eukprot:IDg15689t1
MAQRWHSKNSSSASLGRCRAAPRCNGTHYRTGRDAEAELRCEDARQQKAKSAHPASSEREC